MAVLNNCLSSRMLTPFWPTKSEELRYCIYCGDISRVDFLYINRVQRHCQYCQLTKEEDILQYKMSIGEKIASLMRRPGEDPVAKDDVPWWMKYAGRGLGTVGGLIAIFLGVWNCAFILIGSIMCFISGVWQMIAALIVVMIEAPCCCLFIDFVQNLSDTIEKKPYWNRAAAYCILALPSIFLCPGVNSILGSGLIFATGVIYGLMAVGKKASLEEMRSAAMETPSSSMQPKLIENAQPMDYSNKPDSNV